MNNVESFSTNFPYGLIMLDYIAGKRRVDYKL
jgi:hypothetical protein